MDIAWYCSSALISYIFIRNFLELFEGQKNFNLRHESFSDIFESKCYIFEMNWDSRW